MSKLLFCVFLAVFAPIASFGDNLYDFTFIPDPSLGGSGHLTEQFSLSFPMVESSTTTVSSSQVLSCTAGPLICEGGTFTPTAKEINITALIAAFNSDTNMVQQLPTYTFSVDRQSGFTGGFTSTGTAFNAGSNFGTFSGLIIDSIGEGTNGVGTDADSGGPGKQGTVPEPASVGLFGFGLAGAYVASRKLTARIALN
jgi:PEP-CTERM motif-containing protein